MFIHEERDLQLGADAVGTGAEDRFFDAFEVEFKESAETSDAGQDSVRDRSGDVRFHEFHCLVTGGDVDSGCRVSVRFRIEHSSFPPE